jgi:hypothetical protein
MCRESARPVSISTDTTGASQEGFERGGARTADRIYPASTELSSRPERSVVEGPAVVFGVL